MWEAQVKQLIASGRREEAVRTPCAPGQMARCYVKRVKSFFSSNASFQMFMDSTDVFLLAGRKRKKSKVRGACVCGTPLAHCAGLARGHGGPGPPLPLASRRLHTGSRRLSTRVWDLHLHLCGYHLGGAGARLPGMSDVPRHKAHG